jgi:DNA-binding transcriptional ArsR family regulator
MAALQTSFRPAYCGLAVEVERSKRSNGNSLVHGTKPMIGWPRRRNLVAPFGLRIYFVPIMHCMDSNLAIRSLAALAHESRLAVFRMLVTAGPDGLPAGQIAQQLGVSPSSLSFHLKDLSHAELATSHQDGRYVFYSANFAAMNDLIGFLTENCCAGAPCFAVDALKPCCGEES